MPLITMAVAVLVGSVPVLFLKPKWGLVFMLVLAFIALVFFVYAVLELHDIKRVVRAVGAAHFAAAATGSGIFLIIRRFW